MTLILAFALSLALGSLTGAVAQQPVRVAPITAQRIARVDSLFAPWDSSGRPGYAIGIIQDGRLVHVRGYGRANLDFDEPLTGASVFNAASLAKQFTAACIAILVQRGRVSLDDPVRKYVPGMPPHAAGITVAHLIYMTSGLPEYYTFPRPGGRSWDLDYFTNDDAIAVVLQQPSLRFEPGTQWAYSNVNYMLLAEIVRRVSGVGLADFARREIFLPLGMRDTRFNDKLGEPIPRRVTGYNLDEHGAARQEIRRSPHIGGSGLFTTVEDLARWDRSFTTHQLGGPALTTMLLSTRRFAHDKVNDAFGLVWGSWRGHRTLWYEGGDLGFSSYMVRLPDAGLSAIVLSNLGTGRAAEKGRQVLEVLVPQ